MRNQLTKLQKGRSTKSERKFAEILKVERIPFKTKQIIRGREVDFVIGTYAIEIDSHGQDVGKNYMLLAEGYTPVHLSSWDIGPHTNEWIRHIWQQEQA